MPITLATLFTTPQDIWDLLSVEGVDLREDDHNLGTGQIINVLVDAGIGSTSLFITPNLQYPMVAGTQLKFDGGGMEDTVEVQLSADAAAGANSITVQPLTGAVTASAAARDSGINIVTGARLLVGARKGTSKVKLYCNQRYDDSQLALSGTVLDWATICAAKFICTRRAQGCPQSIAEEYEEAIEEMRAVQAGQLSIESIGTRGIDWPTITNITVNPGIDGMRARVQPNISEGTPTAFGQFVDWNSAANLSF